MSFTFDLIHEPWIPCIDDAGHPIELGLLDVLQKAEQLQEIRDSSPLVTVSLHRLLLAILHRLFGPTNSEAWNRLWTGGQWPSDPITEYFETWQARFDLFHPKRPFYQADDPRVVPKSVLHLVHSSGNNPTLFTHNTDDTGVALTPAGAARALVAAQAFRMGGLSGLPQKFTDAPLARGVVFLIQGLNVFETLALNLLPYPNDRIFVTEEDDRPVWEADDPFAPARGAPFGYLDYLTWQNSRIKLIPESTPDGAVVSQMTLAPGLRLNVEFFDPMKHYSIDSKRVRLLRFNEERALWRDYNTLFELDAAAEGEHPPAVFNWLATLTKRGFLPREVRYRCAALGMANDQAKVFFYRHERMPLPLDYLEDRALATQLALAVGQADAMSKQLYGALMTFAKLLIQPNADDPDTRQPKKEDTHGIVDHWNVSTLYWSRLEPAFWELVETLPTADEAALQQWRDAIKSAARRSFEQAEEQAGTAAEALKAAVKGRGQLEGGVFKVLGKPQEESANAVG